jgi:uncharacterized protein with LGFP repeats
MHHVLNLLVLAADESSTSKTPFYVCGALLAAWAVVVSAIGITQPDFPGSAGRPRGVYAISFLLVAAAIGTAIATS